MKSDDEDIEQPFMMTEHSAEEIADYDEGFAAGSEGKECDTTESHAWQRGSSEAQEQVSQIFHCAY
jgi:hypothetical protein